MQVIIKFLYQFILNSYLFSFASMEISEMSKKSIFNYLTCKNKLIVFFQPVQKNHFRLEDNLVRNRNNK